MKDLTHLNESGIANMVDVSDKLNTKRIAIAECKLSFPADISLVFENGDIMTKKGGVIQTATIAGIMGAKNTSNLIPLCHQIPLDNCDIDMQFDDNTLTISCKVTTTSKTGVEMEALTGCTIAALTVYDMCKAMSHEILIQQTRLIHKSGGKSEYNAQ